MFSNSFLYYQDFESNEKFPVHDYRISHLLPAFCEDRIVRVYSKNPDLVCNKHNNVFK